MLDSGDQQLFSLSHDLMLVSTSSHLILFQLLQENINRFVMNEMKRVQRVLSPDYPECSESQSEDEDEEQRSSREAFLKIALQLLRRMKQEELAQRLQSSKRI